MTENPQRITNRRKRAIALARAIGVRIVVWGSVTLVALAIFIYKRYQNASDQIPKIIEPGQMYLWGQVLYDSRPRN